MPIVSHNKTRKAARGFDHKALLLDFSIPARVAPLQADDYIGQYYTQIYWVSRTEETVKTGRNGKPRPGHFNRKA